MPTQENTKRRAQGNHHYSTSNLKSIKIFTSLPTNKCVDKTTDFNGKSGLKSFKFGQRTSTKTTQKLKNWGVFNKSFSGLLES